MYILQLFLAVVATDPTDPTDPNIIKTYGFCSYPKIWDEFGDNMKLPIIESSSEDTNFDNIIDVITIKIIFSINPSNLKQINIAIGLLYELQDSTKITLRSGFFTTFNSPYRASRIRAIGDLRLFLKLCECANWQNANTLAVFDG